MIFREIKAKENFVIFTEIQCYALCCAKMKKIFFVKWKGYNFYQYETFVRSMNILHILQIKG